MLIDIEIEPSELSRDDLLACLNYAQKNGINSANKGVTHPFERFCDEEHAEELLHDMYEYFARRSEPAPQPVRDFFWHVCGKLV